MKCGSWSRVGAPSLMGSARPVAQRRPALGLQTGQLGVSVEAHPLRIGVAGAAPVQRLRAGQRLFAAPAVGEPRPAARLAQREERQQPRRAQRARRVLRRLGGPDRLARTPRVTREEGRVAEGVRLQGRVPGHPGGRECLRVVRTRVLETPRVVGQPAHGDGQFTGPRVQPLGGRLPRGARVQQGVRGPQRRRRPAVQPVGAVPVVQQPDLANGLFQRPRLGLAGPAHGTVRGRGSAAEREPDGAQ